MFIKASQSSGTQPTSPTNFQNLHHQKRGSLDASSQARRASMHDQYAPKGFLGNMWHKYAILEYSAPEALLTSYL